MASLQDSEAHFRQRAKEAGVDDAFVTALSNNQIHTLAHLAFAIGRPGQEISDNDFDAWVQLVAGAPQTMGQSAAIRRLHFEAEVIITATLKAAVEQPSDLSQPKQVPLAERNARMTQVKARLNGVTIEGANEPAHQLIDECVFQYETRQLRYVEPGKCHSREVEISSGRANKKLKLDNNTLSVKETRTIPEESITTAFQLSQCFKRRAVAYDFAGLITFNEHERYTDALMRHLATEPPPGFMPTSMDQILRADKEVFNHLGQNVPDPRPTPGGPRPLDTALMTALQDYKTSFHLMPLPKSFSSNWNQSTPPGQDAGGNPKGKGKGKKGKSKGSFAAPKGFPDCVGRDSKGRPLCFNFNLGRCNQAAVGSACSRGRHMCFKANCFKPHAYIDEHKTEPKE